MKCLVIIQEFLKFFRADTQDGGWNFQLHNVLLFLDSNQF